MYENAIAAFFFALGVMVMCTIGNGDLTTGLLAAAFGAGGILLVGLARQRRSTV